MFGPRNSSECLYGSGAPNLCANVCTGRVHPTRTNISRSQHRPSSARGRPVQTFDVQTSGGARAAARSGPPPPRKNVWPAKCLAHETLQMFVRVGRMNKCLYVSSVEEMFVRVSLSVPVFCLGISEMGPSSRGAAGFGASSEKRWRRIDFSNIHRRTVDPYKQFLAPLLNPPNVCTGAGWQMFGPR